MRRRDAIALIGLAPFAARAQAGKAKRIVVLFAGNPETDQPAAAPFFLELRRVGWSEGRNINYEYLFARGSREKVAELAKLAAAKQPDLIFAPTALAATSARKATSAIPIVFSTVSDPTVVGLAASLARPGANATGTFQIQADLVAKKFEMLREAMPHVRRVGLVMESTGLDYAQQKQRHLDAGGRSGFHVLTADFTRFDELASVLAKLKQKVLRSSRSRARSR